MQTQYTVTVIIPTYNAAKTIENAVLSVVNQTYSEVELIIVDGQSTDATIPILKKLQQEYRFTFISEKDKGVYDAMNKGIIIAKGEWVYFLGADDILYDNNVLKDIIGNDLNNSFDVLYGDVMLKTSRIIFGGTFNTARLLSINLFHQAIFYKRKLFNDLGLYDLQYPLLADNVFNYNWFSKKSIKRKYINNIIAVYAEEGLSTTNRDSNFKKNRQKLVKTFFGYRWYLYSSIVVPLLNVIKKSPVGKYNSGNTK
jgi:glycosyltransferase involved in cell wall biosynthesis